MRVIYAILIFFYGVILLPFKTVRSYKFSRILTLAEVISFRNLYKIKVQNSKLLKIIRYDDDDDDRQMKPRL